LGDEILEYSDTDTTVSALLTCLTTEELDPSIKAEIVTTLAEIALAIDTKFSKYVDTVLKTVVIAKAEDKNAVEMRESVIDLYSGVIQSIHEVSDGKAVMLNYAEEILTDLYTIAQDEDSTDTLVGSSCGLVGDLALNYPQIFTSLDSDQVTTLHSLLTKGKTGDCNKTKSVAFWASRQLTNACETFSGGEENYQVVKKARVGEEVYYSMKITVSNKQYITQNIETENVTIKLKPSLSEEERSDCSHVEATVRLPPPVKTDGSSAASMEDGHSQGIERNDQQIAELRRMRKKRYTAVPQQEVVGKKSRDAMDSF